MPKEDKKEAKEYVVKKDDEYRLFLSNRKQEHNYARDIKMR